MLWPQGKPLEVWHAFTNLTMLQSAYDVPHVDGVYWTLWTELRFYLLMGLFVLVGVTRRRIVAVCALWPMLGELASRTNQDLVGTLLVHDYAPYFAAGMALYLIHRDGHSWLAWGLVAWNWCLALPLAVNTMAVQNDATDRTGSVPATLALVTLAFVVVGVCGSRWTGRVQWRWLSVAGALTYPLYLAGPRVLGVLGDLPDPRWARQVGRRPCRGGGHADDGLADPPPRRATPGPADEDRADDRSRFAESPRRARERICPIAHTASEVGRDTPQG